MDRNSEKMAQPSYTSFPNYDELTETLRSLESAHPTRMKMHSIGKSWTGRDIWLAEVTNFAHGDAAAKPAFYLDANIHATEVAGTNAALAVIRRLVTATDDPGIDELLKWQVFYVIPRIAVDAADKVIAPPHYILTSTVREDPYNADGAPPSRLIPGDADGDGRMLQMRVRDEAGEWKVSTQDARVLVPRDPDEYGGEYYRLYTEGTIRDYDGSVVNITEPKPDRCGVDFCRNFPANWQPESVQPGAGPHALSEPEIRAVHDFIISHPNIVGVQSLHCAGGYVIRPSHGMPDREMPRMDLEALREIGGAWTKHLGYPILDDYRLDADGPSIHGDTISFTFDQLGIVSFTAELWDLRPRAGCSRVPMMERGPKSIEEDHLKILSWFDANGVGGDGFIDWYPFDHPQLGQVDLGGWNRNWCWVNPPTKFLAEICDGAVEAILSQARSAPRLLIRRTDIERQGDHWKIGATVGNVGYLPTSGTQIAADRQQVGWNSAILEGSSELAFVGAGPEQKFNHLAGRGVKPWTHYPRYDSVPREARVEWVVQAAEGTELTITVRSERAGTHTETVVLTNNK